MCIGRVGRFGINWKKPATHRTRRVGVSRLDKQSNSTARTDVDRYVDGLMTTEEASAFEARLARDPALREEARSLAAVDDDVRRCFGDWRERSPRVTIAAPTRGRRGGFRAAGWLLAAVIALAALAGGGYWLLSSQQTSAERLYHAQLASGFEPVWVCETDFEFARWTNNRLRQPLVRADPMPEGVRAIGCSFVQEDSPLSNRAAVMLAKRAETEVLLLADRVENDRRVRVSRGSELHVFRRELGPLVLYEITPLDAPAALHAVELAPPDIFDREAPPQG